MPPAERSTRSPASLSRSHAALSRTGGRASSTSAIRLGTHKLIRYYEDRRLELFDLERDLGETTDLSESEPERAAELGRKLADYLAAVDAQMPEFNPR